LKASVAAQKKALGALLIQKAIQESRIAAVEVRDRKFVAQLEVDFGLGRGEAEAIGLAVLNKENLLVIDDKNGFNACKLLGIAFTTAANMLVRCREKDLLSSDEAPRKLTLLEKYGRYNKDDSRPCQIEIGGSKMTKTMSIRMDRDICEFVREITKKERSDLSKTVRELVNRGRLMLAIEKYQKGEVSLGRAAELAGLPIGQMMTVLSEFCIQSRIAEEDYLRGQKHLQEAF
jgi:predicted HTH domain antitoxin/predicted nucleic acid-binding protein